MVAQRLPSVKNLTVTRLTLIAVQYKEIEKKGREVF